MAAKLEISFLGFAVRKRRYQAMPRIEHAHFSIVAVKKRRELAHVSPKKRAPIIGWLQCTPGPIEPSAIHRAASWLPPFGYRNVPARFLGTYPGFRWSRRD